MRKILNALFLGMLIFLSGCSGEGAEKGTILLQNIEFDFSGPLDAGSNTAQYEWSINPKEHLRMWGENSKIKTAKLVSATVNDADEYEFDGVNSLVLSLSSDNADLSMAEIAVLNPIKAKSNKQELNLAQEAEIDDYFQESMMYILLDAGLAEAIDDDMKLTADLTFEVTYD